MSRRTLQAYRVTAGTLTRHYFTEHHAEQLARALRMHPPLKGVAVTVTPVRLPDDALTRLSVSP